MQRETSQLLKELKRLEWFENVGRPIRGRTVARVHSWQEALATELWARWGDLLLDAGQNDLSAQVPDAAPDWNEVVDALSPRVDSLVRAKTLALCRRLKLGERFVNRVGYAVLLACLEGEYRRYARSSFNSDVMGWYLRGHFPCGWEGEYPAGRMIVF
jgi:hypothetical protein